MDKSLEKYMNNGRPRVIDLFCGVGGLSLGFEQAGFDVVAGVEIDEDAGRYAQYNFPKTKMFSGPENGDIKNFGVESFKKNHCGPTDIFMIIGGPPCQGFSLAGKRRADDPLNGLVLEYARVIQEFKPPVFLMENVPGLETSNSNMLSRALEIFNEDYNVITPTVLKAWEYGVPQMRKRLFILGIRKDFNITPSLPMPITYRPIDDPMFFCYPCPTCWEAMSDVPAVDEYPELISGDRVEYTTQPQNDFQRKMRDMFFDKDDLSYPVSWNSSICSNLRRTQHSEELKEKFSKVEFGKTEKSSRIRRLDPTDISTTIRAGTTRERGSWSAPRPLHPYQDRVLTTRECARIQTFPDWFQFHPVKWHGNRMVGNAVPPMLA